MPFINPLVFWTGLGAVSVPILIHLLNRRRFRVKDWAAMKFLLESIRKNRRRLRIEELILLALRCLAIVLLSLGVARFTGCSAAKAGPSDEGQGTSVFILDDSMSMCQKAGAFTLFKTACGDLAAELVRTPATSQVAILPGSLSKIRDPIFKRNLLTDAATLAARIRALEATDWRMDLSESLAAANDQFAGVTGSKKLYILSDFRRTDIVEADRVSAIRQQYAKLRKAGVEVVALDYGKPAIHNLTVQEISLLDKFAVAKAPLRVGVTVRNNGSATESDIELRPSAMIPGPEGVKAVTLPVQVIHEIAPGQQASVEFQVVCPEPGPAVVSASLPADELDEDNSASIALEIRKYLRVLVVDGQPDRDDPEESESFYFCRAVDPRQDGSYGIRPEVVSEEGLSGVNLGDYDAIVMMDVSRLPEDYAGPAGTVSSQPASAGAASEAVARSVPPMLGAVENFVRQGGGLLVFAGPRTDVSYYNESLWAQGAGLLPLRVGATMGSEEANAIVIDPLSIQRDNSLAIFQGDGGKAFLGKFRFSHYLAAQESSALAVGEAGAAQVLARFADGRGSPAIAARSFGKGTVQMVYSTASLRWNDWATDAAGPEGVASYPPCMCDTVFAIARPLRPQTEAVPQSIIADLPRNWSDATAVLRTPKYPKEEEVILTRPPEDKSSLLKYESPTSGGVYTLRLRRPGPEEREVFYARNPDPAEGDLTPAGQTVLTAALGGDDYTYRQVKGGDAFGQIEASARKEYWKYAIAALLAVLALEIFLGQRFGHYTAGIQTNQAQKQ